MLKKTSSQFMKSPLLHYRFSQQMDYENEYGVPSVSLDSSGGIKELFGAS
jgi:hypothetical protein